MYALSPKIDTGTVRETFFINQCASVGTVQTPSKGDFLVNGQYLFEVGGERKTFDQIADIPEKKLKKFNELMKDFQQNRLDQIQNQIDDIKHEMDNDPRLKQLEKQIEALENQNDEIDKQKELEEKLLAVEEAKEKLANANKQKTLQVYRERKRICMGNRPRYNKRCGR